MEEAIRWQATVTENNEVNEVVDVSRIHCFSCSPGTNVVLLLSATSFATIHKASANFTKCGVSGTFIK